MDELFRSIAGWVERNYPGLVAIEVSIKLSNGTKARFPVPPIASRSSSPAFRPNAAQTAILEALEGVALRSTELKRLPGLEGRVFKKPRGIQELQERGLVEWDKEAWLFQAGRAA